MHKVMESHKTRLSSSLHEINSIQNVSGHKAEHESMESGGNSSDRNLNEKNLVIRECISNSFDKIHIEKQTGIGLIQAAMCYVTLIII